MVYPSPASDNHDISIETSLHRRIDRVDNGVAIRITGASSLGSPCKRFPDFCDSPQRIDFGMRPCVVDKFNRRISGLLQFTLIDLYRKSHTHKGKCTEAYKRYSFH